MKAVHPPRIVTMTLMEGLVAMKAAPATSVVEAMMVVREGLAMQASASPAMMVMLAKLMVLRARLDTKMVLSAGLEIQTGRLAHLKVLLQGGEIRMDTAAIDVLVPPMVVAMMSAKIA